MLLALDFIFHKAVEVLATFGKYVPHTYLFQELERMFFLEPLHFGKQPASVRVFICSLLGDVEYLLPYALVELLVADGNVIFENHLAIVFCLLLLLSHVVIVTPPLLLDDVVVAVLIILGQRLKRITRIFNISTGSE